MRFRATPLSGAYEIEIEPKTDERVFFARTWCANEFGEHALLWVLNQSDRSSSLLDIAGRSRLPSAAIADAADALLAVNLLRIAATAMEVKAQIS